MLEKTITMSYNDYQMMSLENETFKKQYENLAQEKMVYLILADRNSRYFRSPYVHRMTGEVVEKDELLSRMQAHLDTVQKQSGEVELEYKKRIQELEEQLATAQTQVFIKARVETEKVVTKWWHKLLSNGKSKDTKSR
jgi:hypothetical protein